MSSTISNSKLEELVSCYLHTPKSRDPIIIPQFEHRLHLIQKWSPEATNILEVGCGQGECTLVLAQFVGPSGSVLGIDPGSPNYGSPYTIGQAQEYIKNSALGAQVNFKRSDGPSLLQDPTTISQYGQFQAATMCHSLWYFSSPESIRSLLESLKAARVQKVFLAEHSFQSSNPGQVPHVLAAKAQRRLHQLHKPKAYDSDHERNIRTASTPEELTKLAEDAGWSIERQGVFTPVEGLMDGHWEAGYVLSEHFTKDVETEGLDEDGKKEVMGLVKEVRGALEEAKKAGFERVRCMDTWYAILELK